jgi:hypothetical protein
MAGWDGDALAESMEQAQERQQEAAEARLLRSDMTSAEDRQRKGEEESVRLSRARLTAQLGRATNPSHRTMLERALQSLAPETTPAETPEQPPVLE